MFCYDDNTMAKAPEKTWCLRFTLDPEAEKPFKGVKVFAVNSATEQSIFSRKTGISPTQVDADFRQEVAKLTSRGLSAEEIAGHHNVAVAMVKGVQAQPNVNLKMLRELERLRR